MLRTLMSALITAMLVATGLCIATAVQGWNPWFVGLFLIEAAVVTGFAIAIIGTRSAAAGGAALATVLFGLAIALTVALVNVSRCQSTSPPDAARTSVRHRHRPHRMTAEGMTWSADENYLLQHGCASTLSRPIGPRPIR
jgi:hypothetical protein